MASTSDGPHTPITNIPLSETRIAGLTISPGSLGLGDVTHTLAGAKHEFVEVQEAESLAATHALDLSMLADVGMASFGIERESVLGTDERVRVKNTHQYPWRINASLLITAADNSQWIGTGWFISPRTLVTAGHCVYIKGDEPGRNGWVKKIQILPGRNGSELPFGSMTATEFWSVKGWGDLGQELYDYGAIILPAAFETDLGFYGFGVFDDEVLKASVANIAGYPGDKPQGTLHYDHREVADVNPDKVFYTADTAGGQSGACVYVFHEGKRVGVAIHAYGGATSNSGTRISSQVFSNLKSWLRG
jgi:V8-like Glu-specific endopeptidase